MKGWNYRLFWVGLTGGGYGWFGGVGGLITKMARLSSGGFWLCYAVMERNKNEKVVVVGEGNVKKSSSSMVFLWKWYQSYR